MGLENSFDWLWWLCLVIVIALVVAMIWAVFELGGLLGKIATARHHPQAVAITVCGWLGLVTFVLWPIALVWAFTAPRNAVRPLNVDIDALLADVRRAAERVRAIETALPARGGTA